MDILEFLIADHERLSQERTEMRKNLSSPRLKEQLKAYAVHLDLHESTEYRLLLSELKLLPEYIKLTKVVEKHERDHSKIWEYASELINLLDAKSSPTEIQEKYFHYFAFIEEHVRWEEEGTLFPAIKKMTDSQMLEDLEKKAEKIYGNYTGA